MRPIDANAMRETIEKYAIKNPVDEIDFERNAVIYHVIVDIYDAPTLDVGPVVHAHFTDNNLYGGTMYECSNCKYLNIFAGAYCTNCGAKMDEDGEHNA